MVTLSFVFPPTAKMVVNVFQMKTPSSERLSLPQSFHG